MPTIPHTPPRQSWLSGCRGLSQREGYTCRRRRRWGWRRKGGGGRAVPIKPQTKKNSIHYFYTITCKRWCDALPIKPFPLEPHHPTPTRPLSRRPTLTQATPSLLFPSACFFFLVLDEIPPPPKTRVPPQHRGDHRLLSCRCREQFFWSFCCCCATVRYGVMVVRGTGVWGEQKQALPNSGEGGGWGVTEQTSRGVCVCLCVWEVGEGGGVGILGTKKGGTGCSLPIFRRSDGGSDDR